MAEPIASVVIPAHNEGAVIGRCLSALLEGPRDLEIVVVANNCSDDTAEIARRFGVGVVETPHAGKAYALNLGDQELETFPRVYLDADVVLHQSDAVRTLEKMESTGVLAAAPRLTFDRRGLSRWVRWYYEIWTRSAYVSNDMVGSGVYFLSEKGRARFTHFPAMIADDAFVRDMFTETDERISVREATFVIYPPRSLRALLTIKSRVWAGNDQLRRKGAGSSYKSAPVKRASHPGLAARPHLWPKFGVFVFVYVGARLGGMMRNRLGVGDVWLRDESSREPLLEGHLHGL